MNTPVAQLSKLIAGRNTAQKVVLRASIALAHLNGVRKVDIARQLRTSRPTVNLWIKRFASDGVDGLLIDKTRPGRKKRISDDLEKRIVDATLHTLPAGQTHWTERSMAMHIGVSKMTVHRIWKKYNLQPHLVKSFKVSTDPDFVTKIRDIVGLYMDPPEKALVLCVDEKSQIQALDRTQPGLPMKPGRKGTFTHDFKRHGTTTLFAALNMLNGKVIGECKPHHRATEFLSFLKTIDRRTSKELAIHVILDNYATHKTPAVKEWLEKHPRFQFHFTPTSSSWVNMIERFFGEITNKAIRRGVFRSLGQLISAIDAFIEAHNQAPRIFTWTKDADTIIGKFNRSKQVLVAEH